MPTQRHHPAHPPPLDRHNQPVILFVTVSTWPRAAILNDPCVHVALRDAWCQSDHWLTGYYVVMPDHIHLFCAPGRWDRTSVKQWVRFWKTRVAESVPRLRGCFHADCWDTQMRARDHYLRKLDYVRLNPVRRGLVKTADEWPFAGYLRPLDWL
jgi:putative transposase